MAGQLLAAPLLAADQAAPQVLLVLRQVHLKLGRDGEVAAALLKQADCLAQPACRRWKICSRCWRYLVCCAASDSSQFILGLQGQERRSSRQEKPRWSL